MDAKTRVQQCFDNGAGLPHPTELVAVTNVYILKALKMELEDVDGLTFSNEPNFTAIQTTQNLERGQMITPRYSEDIDDLSRSPKGDKFLDLIDKTIACIANGIKIAVEDNGPMIFRDPYAYIRREHFFLEVCIWSDYVILNATQPEEESDAMRKLTEKHWFDNRPASEQDEIIHPHYEKAHPNAAAKKEAVKKFKNSGREI